MVSKKTLFFFKEGIFMKAQIKTNISKTSYFKIFMDSSYLQKYW